MPSLPELYAMRSQESDKTRRDRLTVLIDLEMAKFD